MNKVININLAGRLIPIDDQAYILLYQYIEKLKSFFSQEEGGDEIVYDMEDRIGELFQGVMKKGGACILIEDVEEVITIMGSPEELGENADAIPSGVEDSDKNKENNYTKRLQRSSKEKIIGGVCGGIALQFNIDPAIVRIAFALLTFAWGTSILLYVLLWIILPETNDEGHSLKRRLYRNREEKVAGGVCAGIGSYLGLDPVVLRLFFASPIVLVIFLSAISGSNFVLSILIGTIPTLVILYCILWVALPEAKTIAQKLEMKGEKVNFDNLNQAIKGFGKKNEDFPKSHNEEIKSFGKRIGSAFALIIKIIVLACLAIVLIAVISALFGLSISYFWLLPYGNFILQHPFERIMLYLSFTLLLIIPLIYLVRALVALFSPKKRKIPKWLNGSLIVLFVASVFGVSYILGILASDFKVMQSQQDIVELTVPHNDTLIIRNSDKYTTMSESNFVIGEWNDWDDTEWGIKITDNNSTAVKAVSMNIEMSPDSQYHLWIEKTAFGKSSKLAIQRLNNIQIDIQQADNSLSIPEYLQLTPLTAYRGESVHFVLQIPQGKTFRLEDLDDSFFKNKTVTFDKRGMWRVRIKTSIQYWESNSYYQFDKSGRAVTTTFKKDLSNEASENEAYAVLPHSNARFALWDSIKAIQNTVQYGLYWSKMRLMFF